jgi:hypothetical protein
LRFCKIILVSVILSSLIFSVSWGKTSNSEQMSKLKVTEPKSFSPVLRGLGKKPVLTQPNSIGSFKPSSVSSGGPDGYGYTWVDSDGGGVVYQWRDITTTGTLIGAADWYSRSGYDKLDDGTAGPFPLGFDFFYQGQTFNSVYISTNGALSFTCDTLTRDGYFYNGWIPNMNFPNVLSAFWNDLDLSGPYGGGYVYRWTNNLDSFLVEYRKVKPFVTSATPDTVTFEVILCSTDSSITYQYHYVATPNSVNSGIPVRLDSSALIGIGDKSRYSGLRYFGMGWEGYQNIPHPGLAVKFKKTQNVSHNLLPGKTASFRYPYFYDEPPAFLWYVKEAGTVFSDNSCVVVNSGESQENNFALWCGILDKDFSPVYTTGKMVSSVLAKDTSLVSFSNSWVPLERGKYWLNYRTQLSSDQVPEDDTIQGILLVEKNKLISPWAFVVPTCDGDLASGEWNDANRYDIHKFILNPNVYDWFSNRTYDEGDAYVLVKNDSNFLYLAFDIPEDSTDTQEDAMLIGIDDNHNGFLEADSSEGRLWMFNYSGNASDSLFFFYLISDATDVDSFVPEENRGAGVSVTGWNYRIKNSGGTQKVEIAIPFGTSPKWKLNSSPGETVGVYFDYDDNSDNFTYGGYIFPAAIAYWPFSSIYDYTPHQFGEIVLSPRPEVPDKPALLFPSNGGVGSANQTFLWIGVAKAISYQLWIDSDSFFVPPLLKDTTVTSVSCVISGLSSTEVWWKVRGYNWQGYGPWSDLGSFTDVPMETKDDLVEKFSLSQNFPNPFNPATTIPFTVIYKGQGAGGKSPIHTTLSIYNILGQKVRILVDEEKLPGEYKVIWDGKDETGEDVASGMYFYKLKSGDFSQSKKMLLLR